MTRYRSIPILLAMMLGVAACESPPSREQGGMIVGGVLGGAIGSQVGGGSGRTVATILGTLIGMSIGGEVGRSMAETDRLKTAHTLETVRSGVPSRWVNPDTGHAYMVTPTRTFDRAGTACREYTVDATIGGAKQQVVGTACRQADGSWRAVQ